MSHHVNTGPPGLAIHVDDFRDCGAFIPSYLDDYPLTTHEFRVYAHYVRRAGAPHPAFPSRTTAAAQLRMSNKTVQRCNALLEAAGLIAQVGGGKDLGEAIRWSLMPYSRWAPHEALSHIRRQVRNGRRHSQGGVGPQDPPPGSSYKGLKLKAFSLGNEPDGSLPREEAGSASKVKGKPQPVNDDASAYPSLGSQKSIRENGAALACEEDALLKAIAEVCGHDLSSLTDDALASLKKTRKQLRKVNATPDEVRARAKVWHQLHDKPLTERALAKWWSRLTSKNGSKMAEVNDVLPPTEAWPDPGNLGEGRQRWLDRSGNGHA